MPITLPNTGLVCPEPGDPNLQACQQIKELFAYVDTIPVPEQLIENPCVSLPSNSWVVEGDADDKLFKQTASVPTGVNPYKSSVSVLDENGCKVSLCIENVSVSTVCVFTNTPGNYSLVFG